MPPGPSSIRQRAPRPSGACQPPSASAARAMSPPSASTAASTPSAFIARCRPGAPSRNRNARAVRRAPRPRCRSPRLRPRPAGTPAGPVAPEAHRPRPGPPRRGQQDRVGRDVAGSAPHAARLQPLEDRRLLPRDAAHVAKAARCTAATVVISATCGRASRASGAISPGAFMPISTTAKSRPPASAPASAARPSGC